MSRLFKTAVVAAAALAACAAMAGPPHGGPGWRGGPGWHGGPHHHHGGWGWGWGWGVGLGATILAADALWLASRPYYGYPAYGYPAGYSIVGSVPVVPSAAPVVVAPAPQQLVRPATKATKYYWCQSSQGYYPQVKACPEGWVEVPAPPADPAK